MTIRLVEVRARGLRPTWAGLSGLTDALVVHDGRGCRA